MTRLAKGEANSVYEWNGMNFIQYDGYLHDNVV